MALYGYAVLAWLAMLVLAVFNGAVRDLAYGAALGEGAAHALSTLVLVVLLLAVIHAFLRWQAGRYGRGDLWGLGMLWLGLTLAFEFGFFGLVMGHPWSDLLADYNVFAGRLWVLVLLTDVLGPVLLGSLVLRHSLPRR